MSDPTEPVHTLSDLAAWSFPGTALAVLGHPVAHSLSPRMQNAALAELARRDPHFIDWRYFRFDVPPEELPRALHELHACGFVGLNLTVPHKTLACAEVSGMGPAALEAGAVNTLKHTEAGWQGFNTDGDGLADAIREKFGFTLSDHPIVLLGAGGAARGAAVACLRLRCPALWIANRTRKNLDALIQQLSPLAGGIPVRGFDGAHSPADLPADALVINATSLGLRPGDPSPIDLSALPRPAAVFDMIYEPPVTPLLAQAQKLGLPNANGLAMLVHQGARALEIWTGFPAADSAPIMASALKDAVS